MVAGGTGSFSGYDNIIRSDPPLTRYHIDEEVVRRKGGHSPHQDFGRPDAFLGEHGVRTLEDRDFVQLGAVVGNDKAPGQPVSQNRLDGGVSAYHLSRWPGMVFF